MTIFLVKSSLRNGSVSGKMSKIQNGTKCCPKVYVLVTNLVIMLGMIFVLIERGIDQKISLGEQNFQYPYFLIWSR